ncbi:MAG TPA: T9SS type A sorting domain-containing protein, partial [Bacteroidetes bacterium]|nr:T9SS type A sorting domain-containing protein [Bacteroidota bacterium]
KLTLHTVTGKQIAVLTNERLPAGHHEVTFSAEGLPSGVYIYRIQAGSFTATRKLTLLK